MAIAAPTHTTFIDDATSGKATIGRFDYLGHWQHLRGKMDGRSNGTSSRSTRVGDIAVLRFIGTRVRLYGVCGPSGGRAGIAIDGHTTTNNRPIDFYAPRRTRMLVYQSPPLGTGLHTLAISVWGTRDPRGHFYYVNIDGAEVDN